MQQQQSQMVELVQPTQHKDNMCFFSMEPLHSAWKRTMIIGNIIVRSLNPSSESPSDTDFQDLMVMLFLFWIRTRIRSPLHVQYNSFQGVENHAFAARDQELTSINHLNTIAHYLATTYRRSTHSIFVHGIHHRRLSSPRAMGLPRNTTIYRLVELNITVLIEP